MRRTRKELTKDLQRNLRTAFANLERHVATNRLEEDEEDLFFTEENLFFLADILYCLGVRPCSSGNDNV